MDIMPITGRFGARITGIDLSKPLSNSEVVGLKEAVPVHKVLVFPGQAAVGPKELAAFGEYFGAPELTPIPAQHNQAEDSLTSMEGLPAVKVLNSSGRETAYRTVKEDDDFWHTDGCTRGPRSWLSILQAVDVPPYGRDTLFADMEAAYDRLSPPVQKFVEGLTALHSYGIQNPDAPPVEHPVVLTNRVTGRKGIYVNSAYTRSIVGLSSPDSRWVLDHLFRQTHLPELQLRKSWEKGDIVMWDNETTQHYAVVDHVYPRLMHRVMVLQ